MDQNRGIGIRSWRSDDLMIGWTSWWSDELVNWRRWSHLFSIVSPQYSISKSMELNGLGNLFFHFLEYAHGQPRLA